MRTLVSHAGRFLVVAALTLIALSAKAEKLALLVGVSTYPYLPADKRLVGPRNDVPIIRDLLVQRAFKPSQIRVLADGVPSGEQPTRENILDAASQLADTAKSGDFVFIYMTGHGSQVPTDQTVPEAYRKPDGRQEVFLPQDVRSWDGTLQKVPNAIADFELTQIVDRIRASGAFVWAVFDSCHSATMVRGNDQAPGLTPRYVGSDDLGIPEAAFRASLLSPMTAPSGMLDSREGSTDASRGTVAKSTPALGEYVAFYAAQPHEATYEVDLPEKPAKGMRRGMFSYALASALTTQQGGTYRQLAETVRGWYAATNRKIPTPMFTGTALDAEVFGMGPGKRILQWPINTAVQPWTIPAGELHGLGNGATLSVLPSPASSDEAALGTVRVLQADLLQSTVAPVGSPGLLGTGLRQAPTPVARLNQLAVNFTLRVALQKNSGRRELDPVLSRLKAGTAGFPPGLRVTWVETAEPHDVRFEVKEGRLWLAALGAPLVRTGSYSTPSISSASLDTNGWAQAQLVQIGKALNLLRIARALSTTAGPAKIKVDMELERNGRRRSFDPITGPALVDGDKLFLTVQNLSSLIAVDVTALYIGDRHQITPIKAATTERMPANANSTGGSRLRFGVEISAKTVGLERLLLIAVDSASGAEANFFTYLAQDGIQDRSRASADDFTTLLEEAGFGPADGRARAGPALVPNGRAQMLLFSFRVVP